MDFQYKDFFYIKTALSAHQRQLTAIDTDDERYSDDEFAEIQDDIMYIERLISMIDREIKQMESQTPTIGLVADSDNDGNTSTR